MNREAEGGFTTDFRGVIIDDLHYFSGARRRSNLEWDLGWIAYKDHNTLFLNDKATTTIVDDVVRLLTFAPIGSSSVYNYYSALKDLESVISFMKNSPVSKSHAMWDAIRRKVGSDNPYFFAPLLEISFHLTEKPRDAQVLLEFVFTDVMAMIASMDPAKVFLPQSKWDSDRRTESVASIAPFNKHSFISTHLKRVANLNQNFLMQFEDSKPPIVTTRGEPHETFLRRCAVSGNGVASDVVVREIQTSSSFRHGWSIAVTGTQMEGDLTLVYPPHLCRKRKHADNEQFLATRKTPRPHRQLRLRCIVGTTRVEITSRGVHRHVAATTRPLSAVTAATAAGAATSAVVAAENGVGEHFPASPASTIVLTDDSDVEENV